jgi:hypothetical protein
MIHVGGTYLAVNPFKTSGSVVDIRRIWTERVQVTVLRIHKFRIRNKYEVEDADGNRWETGRLEPIKQVRLGAVA